MLLTIRVVSFLCILFTIFITYFRCLLYSADIVFVLKPCYTDGFSMPMSPLYYWLKVIISLLISILVLITRKKNIVTLLFYFVFTVMSMFYYVAVGASEWYIANYSYCSLLLAFILYAYNFVKKESGVHSQKPDDQ